MSLTRIARRRASAPSSKIQSANGPGSVKPSSAPAGAPGKVTTHRVPFCESGLHSIATSVTGDSSRSSTTRRESRARSTSRYGPLAIATNSSPIAATPPRISSATSPQGRSIHQRHDQARYVKRLPAMFQVQLAGALSGDGRSRQLVWADWDSKVPAPRRPPTAPHPRNRRCLGLLARLGVRARRSKRAQKSPRSRTARTGMRTLKRDCLRPPCAAEVLVDIANHSNGVTHVIDSALISPRFGFNY